LIFIAFDKWFQSYSIKHVGLDKIFNGKSDIFIGLITPNLEVKPLKMPVSISVRSQIKLIIKIFSLNYEFQIATLEISGES